METTTVVSTSFPLGKAFSLGDNMNRFFCILAAVAILTLAAATPAFAGTTTEHGADLNPPASMPWAVRANVQFLGPNFENMGTTQKLDWQPGEGITTITLDTGLVPGTKCLVLVRYIDSERVWYDAFQASEGFILLKMPWNGIARFEVTILNGDSYQPIGSGTFEYTH